MGTAEYKVSNFGVDDPSTMKIKIDGNSEVLRRVGAAYQVYANTPAAMNVKMAAGALLVAAQLVENAIQTSGTITAPAANPRIDRVVIDGQTGVMSVVTGAEAGSPVPPAIPSGKLPVARIALTVGMGNIPNTAITDERVVIGPARSASAGSNMLRNGSFEDDGVDWTITDYSGGSHGFSASTRHHGDTSLSITSTVLANGGGDALSDEFIPVAEGKTYRVDGYVSASVANVSSRAQVVWYDATQAQISAVNIFDLANTPTSSRHFSGAMDAPTNARFAKVKMIGGVPAAGASTGTIFFDGIILAELPPGTAKLLSGTVSGAAQLDIILTTYRTYRHFRFVYDFVPATDSTTLFMRVSTDGGTTFDAGASDYTHAATGLDDNAASLNQGMTNTSINLCPAGNVGNGAGEGISGEFTIYATNDATKRPKVKHSSSIISADITPRFGHWVGGGMRQAAQDTDAFRVAFSPGNIASGSWALEAWN